MLDHVNEEIVITFRGTINSAGWDTNLDFFSTDYFGPVCGDGCTVHRGLLYAWPQVSEIVLDSWAELQVLHHKYSTIITGQSMGAAIAHLCAAALKSSVPNAPLSLHTYGNKVFTRYIDQQYGRNNYRVTHLNDPVPRLPGRIVGFEHTSPKYHVVSPYIKHVLSAPK